MAGPNLKDDGHGWVHVQHAVSRVTNHRHKPIYIDLDMIEISGIITSKCPLCSFSLATTILFYHWESRAGATMKPKIASVNLGWTERERPPKRPTMTGKRPTMTVNRAWTERETLETIFQCGNLYAISWEEPPRIGCAYAPECQS